MLVNLSVASPWDLGSCELAISSQGEGGTTDLQKGDEGNLEREAETKVIWSQRDGESNLCDSFPSSSPWGLSAPPAIRLHKTILLLEYLACYNGTAITRC